MHRVAMTAGVSAPDKQAFPQALRRRRQTLRSRFDSHCGFLTLEADGVQWLMING
jgi:hypothetical protein